MSSREAALLTLSAMERRNVRSDGYLQKMIREARLDRRDAALATRLCFGVLQNRILLDHYLQQYSSMKLDRMESRVRNALRLGLYQMLFLTKIPVSAAVSESVTLTRRHCKNPRAGGMVNGILRSLARNLDRLPSLDRGDPAAYLSTLYSHPVWLVEEFLERLSPEETEKLLQWDNGEPPVTVQVNTCRYSAGEVVRSLEEDGVTARPHPWLADCLVLSGTGDLTEREAFRGGMFYVQDPAARMAVLALAPGPGARVLDACAAPGGKSFASAVSMEDRGEIVSCDTHSRKTALIEAGARRLGLSSVRARVQDGRTFREEWASSFDAVLTDVPCSGLGVMRKKPEIRYKDPEDLAGLPDIQGAILDNNARYVRPGGVLVYATCTLRHAENEAVAESFLARHPDFRPEGFDLPGPCGRAERGQITLWPQQTDTDGFFLAKFRREGETP